MVLLRSLLFGCAVLLTNPDIQKAGTLTVVSAARPLSGPFAPEMIVSAYGRDLALKQGSSDTLIVVTDSAGVVRPGIQLYISPLQVNFEIPAGTALGVASIAVTSGDGTVSQTSVNIAPVAPGLFSAAELVMTAADGSQNVTTINVGEGSLIKLGPAGVQAALVLFGTGIRGRSSVANVTCLLGGIIPAQVLYAGPTPGFFGLDQVNVIIPSFLAQAGQVSIAVTVDAQPANIVTVDIGVQSATVRATQIVSQMTLDEMIQELHGIEDTNDYRVVPGVPRLGIPALNITNGPAGATNGGPGHQGLATALPAPISLAASWDTTLANLYGTVIGAEAKALANGFLEGPDINIARVPQNGRTFEAFGEDPYLVGQIAAAEIAGIQGQGVIAEAKHFAANNQETNRTTINEIIDERTLHEIYLPAFETSVTKGNAGAVMCAYNLINGVYNCENDLLLNQLLKDQWAFSGFVTSDFGATHSTVASALAGLDLEMPTGIYFSDPLEAAVTAGQVPMFVIQDKLIRRFATMIRFGIFDYPPTNQPVPTQTDGVTARQIAEQGMVLLKNAGNLLPLNASQLHSITVIGPYATSAMTGGGGSSQVVPAYTVNPMAGIQARVGLSVKVSLSSGNEPDASGFHGAVCRRRHRHGRGYRGGGFGSSHFAQRQSGSAGSCRSGRESQYDSGDEERLCRADAVGRRRTCDSGGMVSR